MSMHNITTHSALQVVTTSLILHQVMLVLSNKVHTNHIASHCDNYSISKVVGTEIVEVTMQSCQLHMLECVHFKGHKRTMRTKRLYVHVGLGKLCCFTLFIIINEKYAYWIGWISSWCKQRVHILYLESQRRLSKDHIDKQLVASHQMVP